MTYAGARFTVRSVPWGTNGQAWAVWDIHDEKVVEIRSDVGTALELAWHCNLRLVLGGDAA